MKKRKTGGMTMARYEILPGSKPGTAKARFIIRVPEAVIRVVKEIETKYTVPIIEERGSK